MRRRCRCPRRSGSILVLTAVLMIAMMAFMAFALDVGYMYVTRSQLQRSADAAAIAAAWDLLDEDVLVGGASPYGAIARAGTTATTYAGLNPVALEAPGLGFGDIVVGYLADPTDPTQPMNLNPLDPFNAIKIRVRRTSEQNGEIPLFFAQALGFNQFGAQAEATAAFATNFSGFRTPSEGGNLQMLPLALDLDTWNGLLNGIGTDDWTWDPVDEVILSGPDGIREVNLFPQGMGSPGNRGTVDIGSCNNSTADIARQILNGISPDDLDYHGGKLELDEYGELDLNGDTGISAGVKDELASIKGDPKLISVFQSVVNPGNNAEYTIVRFIGIRVMEVQLTGSMSNKRVIVQPALVKSSGGIPSSGASTSDFIYSPVRLIR